MAPRFATLRRWAALRDQPVTVFDLETTTNIPYVHWMGITEVGAITLCPDGTETEISALVDPGRSIGREVAELTGIQNADVRGKPTWEKWAEVFKVIAREHVVVGFNCLLFDCVVVARQNERYGVSATEFASVLDARALPGMEGSLVEVASRHGVELDNAHRALSDARATADLVEFVARRDGLDLLETKLRRCGGEAMGSPRAEREAGLLEHFGRCGRLPELEAFAVRCGVKKSTVEGDVLRLIEAVRLPAQVLEAPGVQQWLSQHLESVIAECWIGAADGRLKPLHDRLAPSAPPGFDYTQLRIALMRRRQGP